MKSSARNIELKSVDDLFATEESRADAQREKVQNIPLRELHPFRNHPFKVKDDAAMQDTVDSVREHGVLVPAIARPDPDGGYELIAGHRRHHASELAGKETMPVIIRDLDDDAATIIMVDSNLQREELLPSERAFAYKMKLEALKHQGARTDLTSRQVVGKLEMADIVGKNMGESGRQVQRFIRLTELIPTLLDMVDERKIALNPAVELSYLKKEEQIEEDIYQKIIENAKKANKEEKQKILEYLNWKYPHEEIEGVPTKTSVTKIKEMVNAEQVEEQTKNVKFAVEETKEAKAITQKPKFVNNNENAKISNAQKGTLMHLCVQKMNEKEEYTAEKIQELIDELKQREILSETEAESINISKLQGYTKSDLWQELKNAKEIHKEKAFYINVKASRMYEISKENDENILVQGIIDLYYIDKDGKLVLVDYKTDYVEAEKENELVEKYKEQLYLYKDALEKALNRKVDRMWIYSLYLNESIVIEK